VLHLFEDYIYTLITPETPGTLGMVQWSDTTIRLSLLPGFVPRVINFALIFVIPPRMHSHLTSGNSEIIYTNHSQNLRNRYGTVVKHAYQAASTRVQHLIFKVVSAKPTPHFLIPAAFYYAFKAIRRKYFLRFRGNQW
jgi:hypothetical protein